MTLQELKPLDIRSLSELPRGIAPAHDLWPGIAAQIAPPERIERRPAWRFAAGLAAAIALLGVGIWFGRASVESAAGSAPMARVAAGGQSLAAVSYAPGAKYFSERAALMKDLDARIARLPPASQAKVVTSLATIRSALHEIEAALGKDPANSLLHALLVNTYQEEMQLLATINQEI